MSQTELATTIDTAFDRISEVGPSTAGAVREAVETALDLLDRGAARVAERRADGSMTGARSNCRPAARDSRPA